METLSQPKKLMREENLITWKDADLNLCRLVMGMLEDASYSLRSYAAHDAAPLTTTMGKQVGGGYAEDNSNRTFFSGRWDVYIFEMMGDYSIPYMWQWLFDEDTQGISLQCWWSFQNILRYRLKEARKELKRNLYQNNRSKVRTDKNFSRNLYKRVKGVSKFGRQER